jgi:hypothetical protein
LSREYVTFGVQAGDPAADEVVRPHYLRLRNALSEHCKGDYSETIKSFDFVLRIDGALWHWRKTGCGNLRVSPKLGYCAIDIFMPVEVWEDPRASRIPSYLHHYTEEGFEKMMARVASKKITIACDEFCIDFGRAMAAFRDGHPKVQ